MIKRTIFYTIILMLGLQTQQIQATPNAIPDYLGHCQANQIIMFSTMCFGAFVGYISSISLAVLLESLMPTFTKKHKDKFNGFIILSILTSACIGQNIGTGFANENIHQALNL